MKVIYKYPLATHVIPVAMPAGAELLTVQAQQGEIMLWAEVETSQPFLEERVFHIVGTGRELPRGVLKYVGTVQLHGGQLVWHVYEVVS